MHAISQQTVQNTEYRILNTEHRIQKLMYIKLPMYMFFYMGLGLKYSDAGKSIIRPLEGVGPENQDFLGPFGPSAI